MSVTQLTTARTQSSICQEFELFILWLSMRVCLANGQQYELDAVHDHEVGVFSLLTLIRVTHTKVGLKTNE